MEINRMSMSKRESTSVAPSPPVAIESQELLDAREAASDLLRAAERAWYKYAGLCEVGPERTRAFDVYENVRTALRV
jgi:hypothetical protein